jgi:hypothetical protein
MILTDPSQLPEPDKEEPKDDQRPSSVILGSLVIDGALQMFMTWWFAWILRAGFGYTDLNPYLWWAGCTLMYVTLHWQASKMSGVVLVKHIQILLIGTAYVWIFK